MKAPNLQIGSKGDDVRYWQAIVGTKTDGDFGPKTAAATKVWQRDHNLLETGLVTSADWDVALKENPRGNQTYLVDKITTATPREAVRGLLRGIRMVTGAEVKAEVGACVVAHSALETGHWKACHWWNFGNVKASWDFVGNVTYFGCNEVFKDKAGNYVTHWYHPIVTPAWPGLQAWVKKHANSEANNSQCRWRAFETLEEGGEFQISFLRKHYYTAWQQGLAGSPEGMSRALKKLHYYTANVDKYTKTMVSLYRSYLPLVQEVLPTLAQVVLDEVKQETPDNRVPVPSPTAKPTDDETIDLLELSVPWDEIRESRNASVAELD